MLDELSAIKSLQESQRRWKRTCLISFLIIIAVNSAMFVVIPKDLPGLLFQALLIITMFSVFGMVFLDVVAFHINKQLNKKDILYKYLLQHLKAEDVHKDVDLVVQLIKDRRIASQELKKF